MTNRKGIGLAVIALVVAIAGIGITSYSILFTSSLTTSNLIMSKVYYCSSGTDVQNSINTIGSGNGMIYITKNITLSDSIDIDGGGDYIIQGMGLVTIKIEGNYCAFNITRASSCIIKELVIDGTSITIDTVSMIRVREGNDNPVIVQEVQFYRGARGINIESDRVWVEECTFIDLDYGVYLYYANKIHILNNIFDDINKRGIVGSYSKENIIDGNIMENCYIAIYLYADCDNSIISDNIIRRITSVGIQLIECYYNSIVGNLICYDSGESSDVYGIHAFASNYDSFTGNAISYVNSDGTGTGYGFYLEYSTNNIAIGNILVGNDVDSIYENGCSGNVITPNN